ncbi:hypothetical protein LR48_Vigan02g053000 [Vigna angularis]|uniref:Retrotransposon gag domain-containing protein n=2 Tax=Phaseolus angularis TaxID=3914 RepID=A0A0L9TUZ3_PHAAN|nr:hypothetical protein LR48_Vigan02g053000 [Vigna angularis]BAT96210.1 hypothetical protein VIGAN_08311200 [Vigna angularis var. angularis]
MKDRIDGRLNVMEGQIEAVEIAVDRMKAETAALRQDSAAIRKDLQEVMRILGGRTQDQEGLSDGSQASVNEHRRARWEDEGGREVERTEGKNNGQKRVELPVFEGIDPLNWINRAKKFFELQGVSEDEKVQLAYISMEGSAGYWFHSGGRRPRTVLGQD